MPIVTSKYTSLYDDCSKKDERLDSVHDMFVGASMKFVYVFFMFAFYLTAEHVSDLDWSVILTFGSIFQTLGWYALLHKIIKQRSVSGVSLHSVELFIVVYAVRLWTTIMKSGYLPVDSSGDGLYQAADLIGLAIACGIWKCLTDTHRSTYNSHTDTLDLRKCLPCCVLVALLIHGDLNDCFIFDTLYYIAVNVETLALMPQLWMFANGDGQVDGMTSHFVVMQTFGRVCSLVFWWYGMTEIGEFTTYNVAGIYLVVALAAQVLQCLDFTFYYAKARITGARMVLPGL
jgi:uncharacterized protein with PQ loop repeat